MDSKQELPLIIRAKKDGLTKFYLRTDSGYIDISDEMLRHFYSLFNDYEVYLRLHRKITKPFRTDDAVAFLEILFGGTHEKQQNK